MKLNDQSKFLSLVLRHKPQELGLELDVQGWVSVDRLLRALNEHNRFMSRDTLERLVSENDKKRFTLSQDGLRIRAAQGHSVAVHLDLPEAEPPEVLFHGTAVRFLDPIRREGLRPMQRHHVHLSEDRDTAAKVGQRYGKLQVLCVDAHQMKRDGHKFFVSENGVWLTDKVPREYLSDA